MFTLLVNGNAIATNQSVGSTQTVVFSGNLGSSSFVDPSWYIDAPDESSVTASGWTATDSTQTFTPDVPGSYVVTLSYTMFGSLSTLTCRSEVQPHVTFQSSGSRIALDLDANVAQQVQFSSPIDNVSYSDAVWEIYGPSDSEITTTQWVMSDSLQTFTPDVPGRYLIKITATNVSTGNPETYTCLAEIRDPQVPQASIPAPNEEDEYDGNEGWSRSTEAFLRTMSRGLPLKNIVSVTLTSGVVSSGETPFIPAGSIVSLDLAINGPLEAWKACAIDRFGSKGNNVTLSVLKVDSGDAVIEDGILFYLLDNLFEGKKSLALVSGVVNATTSGMSDGSALYVSSSSQLSATAPSSPAYTRKVGFVLKGQAAGDATPNPGAIYFNGLGPALSNFIEAQPAGVDGQVQYNNNNSFDGAGLYYTGTGLGVLQKQSSGGLHVTGGVSLTAQTITSAQSPYAVHSTDYAVFCDTSTASVQVDLPNANITGRILVIKDVAGTAGTNNITLNPQGSDTIDGGTSLVISADYGSITLQCSYIYVWSIITYS